MSSVAALLYFVLPRLAGSGQAGPAVTEPGGQPGQAAATAAPAAALTTFNIVRRVRDELGVNMSTGASNISFGLPDRHGIDSAFLPMLMAIGVACSITNPLAEEVRRSILAADVLLDNDEYSMAWVAFYRKREAALAATK